MSITPIGFHSDAFKAAVAGDLDLSTCQLSLVPVDLRKYAPQQHQHILSSIPKGAICGAVRPLERITFIDGVLDADNVIFDDVPYGCQLGLVCFVNSDQGDQRGELLFCVDMKWNSTGGQLMVSWDDGPCKIADFWIKRKLEVSTAGSPA